MKKTRLLASAAAALALALPAASPALADTVGQKPSTQAEFSCGALRDIPNEWTVEANAGHCPGWGYSYILTSPSNVHYATWTWSDEGGVVAGTSYNDPIEVWVPSYGAGAEVEYDYQFCGSSTWHLIGDLNQEADSGWYTPGTVPVSPTVPVCSIREHNVGSGTWDMAEDEISFRY